MKKLILICKFCGIKTGEYQYPDNLTEADLGIADVRCETCEALYGPYKQEPILGSKLRKKSKKSIIKKK